MGLGLIHRLTDLVGVKGTDGAAIASTANPVPVALPEATVTALTPPAAITGFATEAKQLPDGHNVTVANPTANPETGLAKETKQDTQITHEAAIRAAVEVIDDWDEADRAKVNPIVGQAGVDGGSGVITAKTQRTSLATDDKLFNAARLAGLTFAQTINTASNYETAWFDARAIPWLNFRGEIPATSAFTADLTSSTAEDPNSPASEDFTSVSSATIAGTSLGAPNNTPSFSFAGGGLVGQTETHQPDRL